jgi:ABC-type nickel/cobalt efflux system permease component RcnA
VAVLAAGLGAALAGLLAGPASPAQAHPLGNFSVNQYAGLTLRPDRVDVIAVADTAEIPTLQEKPLVDTNGDGTLSPDERATYAAAECRRFAGALVVSVAAERLVWTVSEPSYDTTPGAAGLQISRLACRLAAPARLDAPATVRVDNGYRSGRVGWRELTAKGEGVRLAQSPIPTESISGQLRTYPRDLLASAPDVRTATIRTAGAGAGGVGGTTAAAVKVAGPDWLAAAQSRVETVLGGRLTPLVIGLAFLLALLLGAGHAALPGHGKTVMAAYFAGRRGRIRDALAVGGTVTIAHTGGVLLVGLLLSTSTALAGERLLGWLGAASGVLVVAVGIGMLVSALRSRRHGPRAHPHSHSPQAHPHSHGPHGHTHGDGAGHTHGGHGHRHGAGERRRPGGRLGLAGIGLAGGLVPSPSALVVLLGAIGLGRAGLGVLLVLAYGIGMAGTLTAVGLLLVVAQNRLGRVVSRGGRAARVGGHLARITGRISASAPTATAALVVLVGLGMGVRAVA